MKDRIFISIPKFFFWSPVYHAGYLSYPIRRISTITFGELFLSASNSIIIAILLEALYLNLYIRSPILDWSLREHLQVSRALPVAVIFICPGSSIHPEYFSGLIRCRLISWQVSVSQCNCQRQTPKIKIRFCLGAWFCRGDFKRLVRSPPE